MKTSTPLTFFTFLLVFVIAFPALAYQYPLSPETIREAYFLGTRNDELSAQIFLKYTHSMPKPKSGPYIAWIGIETPFTAVATQAAQSPNDRAQEAEHKFLGKPLPFRVRVEIDFTETYPNPTISNHDGFGVFLVSDFWKDFKVKLVQDHEIPSEAVRAGPIYSYYTVDVTGIAGAEIELDYNPERIVAQPTEIEVITPDGQKVKTSFDLSTLN